MKRIVLLLISFLLLFSISCANAAPEPTAVPEPTVTPTPDWIIEGWELEWHDEFDGTELNTDYWTPIVSGDGGGNGEVQFYTDRPENLEVKDGNLLIHGLEEAYRGKLFTSARLETKEKVEVQYGRIETRMQIPVGQGYWPAFWMLGINIDEVGWPFAGEIDIMENIGSEPKLIHGTIHGPRYSGGNGMSASKRLTTGAEYADNFHVFAIEWEEDEIRWYMDGQLYHVQTPESVPDEWVYNQPFYMILNLAIGGEWPGYPGRDTVFPQTLKVDYVRVYKPAPTQ